MDGYNVNLNILADLTRYEPLPTSFVPFVRKPEELVLLRDVYYNFKAKIETENFFEEIKEDFPSLSTFYFLVEVIFLGQQRTDTHFISTLKLVNFCPRNSNIARFANNLIPTEAIQVILSLYPLYKEGAKRLYYIQDYDDLLIFHDRTANEYCNDAMKTQKVFKKIQDKLMWRPLFSKFLC